MWHGTNFLMYQILLAKDSTTTNLSWGVMDRNDGYVMRDKVFECNISEFFFQFNTILIVIIIKEYNSLMSENSENCHF